MKDLPLARKYTNAIRMKATGKEVPSWAREMEIYIMEDMNELESAKTLLAGLLYSGQITDARVVREVDGSAPPAGRRVVDGPAASGSAVHPLAPDPVRDPGGARRVDGLGHVG